MPLGQTGSGLPPDKIVSMSLDWFENSIGASRSDRVRATTRQDSKYSLDWLLIILLGLQSQTGSELLPDKIVSMSLDWSLRIQLVPQGQTRSELLPDKIVSMSLDWSLRILLMLQGQTGSELLPDKIVSMSLDWLLRILLML